MKIRQKVVRRIRIRSPATCESALKADSQDLAAESEAKLVYKEQLFVDEQ